MAKITLSHLNESLLEKLKVLAMKNSRSLEEEIESILEDNLQTLETTSSEFEKAWEKVDQARQQHSQSAFSDSAELLREDRQR